MRLARHCLILLSSLLCLQAAPSATRSIVVYQEEGFPSADTAQVSAQDLRSAFPEAIQVPDADLESALSASSTRLLVMPFGSAFPEAHWPALQAYLRKGGNLLVLGGRPFTRAAFRQGSQWKLRDYSVRFIKLLNIDQYQAAPGSQGLDIKANPDLEPTLPAFGWRQAWCPVIRLSSRNVSTREGAAGALDARLDALVYGWKKDRRMASPLIQIDHLDALAAGGRWIFAQAELEPHFLASEAGRKVCERLAQRACRGAEDFQVQPDYALYLPGETVRVTPHWKGQASELRVQLKVIDAQSGKSLATLEHDLKEGAFALPVPQGKGLFRLEGRLLSHGQCLSIHRSAFWMRDEASLNAGPKLSVDADHFLLDGRPMAVAGTTYMASDVQRLFLEHPNVQVWDRDLAELRAAGLNMIRTGWWSGWDKLLQEDGRPHEATLRAVEAFLMTAHRHQLPVQFNLFAFLPWLVPNTNSYLDAANLDRQKALLRCLASRFGQVPDLAWDFINEPSFGKTLWRLYPNGDEQERQRWNAWLAQEYPDRPALLAAWNLTEMPAPAALPSVAELSPREGLTGPNAARSWDFARFAQGIFREWVHTLHETLRQAGSRQLVTVGQDEGGNTDRLPGAFFADEVDFTCMHTWWQNDTLLWSSLTAKQPGKPMLVQETGLQRETTLEDIARRSLENEGALFERKAVLSFARGAGAIQWLWHPDAYMDEPNETPIGALRCDGTEKPEAQVMRGLAAFAQAAGPHFTTIAAPEVVVLTSQTDLFSGFKGHQLHAQQAALRALCYANHMPASLLAENRIGQLGQPKLVILPSAQTLQDSTWAALRRYVEGGGHLLMTGSMGRDEHWHPVDRFKALGFEASLAPLTFRHAQLDVNGKGLPLVFGQDLQGQLECVQFKDGASLQSRSIGKGQLIWSAYPVELSEGLKAATQLYAWALSQAGVQPGFELVANPGPGVLVYAVPMQNATLYLLESESALEARIDLKDSRSGAPLRLSLPAEHAALALVDAKDGRILAHYGF